jgi:AraC-like DNA-binding protein
VTQESAPTDGTAMATIRAMAVMRIVEWLETAPFDLLPLERAHPACFARLRDSYARVPLLDYLDIFERAARLTAIPAFGARMGQGYRPADIGPLGLLFSLSASLHLGFERMIRLLPAFQSSTSVALLREGEDMAWTYRVRGPESWPRVQDAEYAISATCAMVRSSRGAGWNPLEVRFEHARPEDPAALRSLQAIFRCPVAFDQGANAIVMPAREVEERLHRENRDLTAVLERHLGDLLLQNAAGVTLRARVESAIDLMMGQRSITLRMVAASLGMTERTLQRRLAEEGLTLRAILQDMRLGSANHRLGSEDVSVSRVAERLGYADPTSFSRAYRRWTGVTPSSRRA